MRVDLLTEEQVKELIGFNQSDVIHSIMEMSVLLELDDNDLICESMLIEQNGKVETVLNKQLNKLGLKVHKTRGLIDIIKDFGIGFGQLLVAAVKGDKAKVKQIAKSVTKEDFLDFLLKLDMATLHVVTGPIHMIDAITGWDLWANVKQKAQAAGAAASQSAQAVVKTFKDAIEYMKNKAKSIFDPKMASKLIKRIETIEKSLAPQYINA